MGGKRTAIDAALFGPRLGGHHVLLVLIGLVRRNRLLDILKRHKQLLGVKLLRTPAKLRTLQLAQKVSQSVNLRTRLVALGDRSVALRAYRCHQRMQRFDVRRKLRRNLAHAQH